MPTPAVLVDPLGFNPTLPKLMQVVADKSMHALGPWPDGYCPIQVPTVEALLGPPAVVL